MDADEKHITVEAGLEREMVVVRFRDSGPGIANPDHCFSPSSLERSRTAWASISPGPSFDPTEAICAMSPVPVESVCGGVMAR